MNIISGPWIWSSSLYMNRWENAMNPDCRRKGTRTVQFYLRTLYSFKTTSGGDLS